MMALSYNGNIMERLKDAGWSEYLIRKYKVLSTSTIKALRAGDTHISAVTLDRICEMLGGVQPNEVLVYTENEHALSNEELERRRKRRDQEYMQTLYDEYNQLENPEMERYKYIATKFAEYKKKNG